MKKRDFNNLVASVRQAGRIRRGEQKPSRVAEFRPLAYLPKPFPIEALLRLVFTAPDRPPEEQAEADDI